jgi:hypothetical protein
LFALEPARRARIHKAVTRGEAVLDPEDAAIAIEYALYKQRQAENNRSSPALILFLLFGLLVAFVPLLEYGPGMGDGRGLFTISIAGVTFLIFAAARAAASLRLERTRRAERLNRFVLSTTSPHGRSEPD